MKTLAETKALKKLRNLKTGYKKRISETYEHRAQDCRDLSERRARAAGTNILLMFTSQNSKAF